MTNMAILNVVLAILGVVIVAAVMRFGHAVAGDSHDGRVAPVSELEPQELERAA